MATKKTSSSKAVGKAPKAIAKTVLEPAAKHSPKKQKPIRVVLNSGAQKPSHLGGLGRGLDSLIGRAQAVAPSIPEGDSASRGSRPPAEGDSAGRGSRSPADADRGSRSPAEAAQQSPTVANRPAEAPGPVGNDLSAQNGKTVLEIDAARIKASPWQPRRVFEDQALQELAESIKVHGIIQPLVCRTLPDGEYELIGGERRLRAALSVGLEKVPVLVMDTEDRQAAELALVENLQREDLNVIEEAEGYKALAEQFSLSQNEIAERVGKGRATVANTVRLLELPEEVKSMLSLGTLSTGHAKVLLSVEGDAARMELARQCLNEGLTVRALERRVQRKAEERIKRPPVPDITPDYLKALLEKLHEKFATSIRLIPSCVYANGHHGRGRLEIDYLDNDDLSRLLEILNIDMNAL